MTRIREKTLAMIEKLPDDKIVYIFNILQNIEALSNNSFSDFIHSTISVLEPKDFLKIFS